MSTENDIIYKVYDMQNRLMFVCNTPASARDFLRQTFNIEFQDNHQFNYGQISNNCFKVVKYFQPPHQLHGVEKKTNEKPGE